MAKINIIPKKMFFQRNGIGGEGFFILNFNWFDADGKKGENFVATFSVKKGEEKEINTETCRVINPNDLSLGWRGDNFGYDINSFFQEMIKENSVEMVYDLMKIINEEGE